MAHPRVEEVEDSDVEMSDPSEGDIDDFDESDILRARTDKQQQLPIRQQQPQANPHILNPSHIPSVSAGPPAGGEFAIPTTTAANAKAYAHFQCLYPVYFDARRTRAGGRRVGKALAVPNPLARELVNACRALRLQTLFEPEKMHPKDWANPGRVKVHLRGGDNGGNNGIKNKHQLYLLVAQHLRNHPTTDDKDKGASGGGSVLWERIPGGPPPPDRAKPYPRPAVPRGWAMGDLLPYYSPAMTGGGVSENLFKDMMKEMQGGGGAPGGGGGGMPALPGGMDMASLMSAMGGGGAGGMGGLMGGGSPGAGSGNASEDGGGGGGGGKKKGKKGKGKA